MKVTASVKKRTKCKGCQIVVRKRSGKPVRYLVCSVDPRHKRRQG